LVERRTETDSHAILLLFRVLAKRGRDQTGCECRCVYVSDF